MKYGELKEEARNFLRKDIYNVMPTTKATHHDVPHQLRTLLGEAYVKEFHPELIQKHNELRERMTAMTSELSGNTTRFDDARRDYQQALKDEMESPGNLKFREAAVTLSKECDVLNNLMHKSSQVTFQVMEEYATHGEHIQEMKFKGMHPDDMFDGLEEERQKRLAQQ